MWKLDKLCLRTRPRGISGDCVATGGQPGTRWMGAPPPRLRPTMPAGEESPAHGSAGKVRSLPKSTDRAELSRV